MTSDLLDLGGEVGVSHVGTTTCRRHSVLVVEENS